MIRLSCLGASLLLVLSGYTSPLAAGSKTTSLEVVSAISGKLENNLGVGDFDDPQRQVAQAPSSSASQNWKYTVTPYLWIPNSVKGDSTIDGAPPSKLDYDLSDIIEHLDFGASVRVEAWKGRFGVILDAAYVDLGGEPAPPLDWDVTQTIVDFRVGYEVARTPIGAGEGFRNPMDWRFGIGL